jgi:hypothetical protein
VPVGVVDVEFTVNVAEPDITTKEGVRVTNRLDEALYVRLTLPEKPPNDETVIALDPAEP